MSDSIQPRLSTRLLSVALSIPLRFKILIPYLVGVMLLATLATWRFSQSLARALQEQFQSQLTEDVTSVRNSVLGAEAVQLDGLRTITQASGLAEAVAAHNWEAVDGLIRPLAGNADFSLIHIIDRNGMPIYGLRALPNGFAENENAPFTTWSPVMDVLKGRSDTLGDKFAAVVEAPWGLALYTAGPLKLKDELVGVILVGSPMADLLATLPNGPREIVTVYRPIGQAILSTLAADRTPSDLDSANLQTLGQSSTNQLRTRSVSIDTITHEEALEALVLRGQATSWVIGVARPRTQLDGVWGPAELIGWFLLAGLVLTGLGLIVVRLVVPPISDLTAAVSEIGQGNVNVTVKEYAKDEVGELSQKFNWMVRELRQRNMLREMFGQVVSAEVRDALQNGKIGLGGELKVATILFTDIRDFTSLAENFNPQEVVTLLNNYFEVVSAAIHKSGGFINRFGGDSTMAVFGAPLTTEPSKSAHQAMQAAFAIRTHLAEFNARQIERGQQPIRIGIGISTGEVVTGNIGSHDRYEYTVIGDTVNTAARVQSLSSRFNDSNILITEDTREALGKDAQLLVIDHGDVALKGKQKLVRVYGVMGMRFAKAEPVFQVGGIPRRDVLEALYLYCKGFHPRVIGQTKNIDPLVVNQWIDGATRVYERSCEELRQEFALTDGELHRLTNGNGNQPATETKTLPETVRTNGNGRPKTS